MARVHTNKILDILWGTQWKNIRVNISIFPTSGFLLRILLKNTDKVGCRIFKKWPEIKPIFTCRLVLMLYNLDLVKMETIPPSQL